MSVEGKSIMVSAINKSRFLDDLFTQGKIGWKDGVGLQRQAYSKSYLEARDWLKAKMEDTGLKTRVDGVGNLFGCLEGKTETTILLGSHLDSVNNGGVYDGPLGIVAALEVLRVLKEEGELTEHSFEVVAFIGEEGEPLGGTFGSRVFAGLLPPNYRTDILSKFGIDENAITKSRGDFEKYAAFIELHIEQGPFLERNGFDVGIPSGIVGITRLGIRVKGVANHAGTTPMAERRDAMRSAAELINNWFAWMDGQESLVCNVGVLNVVPMHVSIVPEEVYFVLELRSIDDTAVETACSQVSKMARDITKCSVTIETLGAKSAVLLDDKIVRLIKDVAAEAKYSAVVMPSGASHDSSPISHVMPTGMIFVPSRDGISHSKDEFTSDRDVVRGAELLKAVVCEIDHRF